IEATEVAWWFRPAPLRQQCRLLPTTSPRQRERSRARARLYDHNGLGGREDHSTILPEQHPPALSAPCPRGRERERDNVLMFRMSFIIQRKHIQRRSRRGNRIG